MTRLGYREQILIVVLPHYKELNSYLWEKTFGQSGLHLQVNNTSVHAVIPELEPDYVHQVIMPWINAWFKRNHPHLSELLVPELFGGHSNTELFTHVTIPLTLFEQKEFSDVCIGRSGKFDKYFAAIDDSY